MATKKHDQNYGGKNDNQNMGGGNDFPPKYISYTPRVYPKTLKSISLTKHIFAKFREIYFLFSAKNTKRKFLFAKNTKRN